MDKERFFNNALFDRFSKQEFELLFQVVQQNQYEENQTIIKKNDSTKDLYVIGEGKVKIVEKDDGSSNLVIGTLSEGEFFGELAFVDQKPRSVSVIALEPTSVWVLSPNPLAEDPHYQSVYKKLLKNLMTLTLQRLRNLDLNYAQNLELNLNQLNQQKRSGIYVIRVFCIISLILILEFLLNSVGLDVKGDFSSFLRIILVGILTIYVYKKENVPLEESGLTLKNWPRALLEGTAIGVVLGLITFLLFGIFNDFQFKAVFYRFLDRFEVSKWLIIYVFHSFIQEFIVRVGFQFSVSKFLNDQKGTLSIFITSLIFASMHTHWTWQFVVSIFVGNLIFGYIYQKRRSIVEMTAVHYFSGIVIYFLGDTK